MFVRKGKPTGAISRPVKAQTESNSETQPAQVKALGGWDGDEEKQETATKTLFGGSSKQVTTNIFGDEEFVEAKVEESELPSSTLYSYDELEEMENLEHETRLVQEIVQPGGIKIKPNQGMLGEFAQAAKTLDKNLIGSLLISKLSQGFPYQVKAKALYTIEYLSKKNQTYKEYFQQFTEEIRGQPEPSDNAANYNKLLNEVLGYVENISEVAQVGNEANLIEFGNGPDYNKDLPWDNNNQKFGKIINSKKIEVEVKEKEKEEKKTAKKFISPNEAKRIQKLAPQEKLIDVAQSTEQQKPKTESNAGNSNFNIFDLEFSNPNQTPANTTTAPPPSQPQSHPLTNLYQAQINPAQMTQQQYQQYLYQQQQLQQQMLAQQYQQQKQQQQFLQGNQSQKPITGAQLYSMYK